jgi:glucose-6-phosphate 1-dehydrogenase
MSPARVTASENPLRDPRDKRLPRIAGPCSMVLFGVTGDLARKKLMPAIYDLANRGLLPPGFSSSGSPAATGPTRTSARSSTTRSGSTPAPRSARRSGAPSPKGCASCPGTFDDDAPSTCSRRPSPSSTSARDRRQPRLLPVDPAVVLLHRLPAARAVGAASSNGDGLAAGGHREAVRARPGQARKLNTIVENVFPADSVFRIDHYLGKETVQNLLALRFANQMFEPVWNANYVDHVQITMAEDIGIGGRAGYYDGIGAARDVIQNHLLQLLALTAMEEPASFDAHGLRAEKEKVLSAVRIPADLSTGTARGQYAAGWQGGEEVVGYLEEEGIAPARAPRRTRPSARRRHPPLGRGPVLPAHRQATGQAGHRDRGGLQAAPHLPFTDTATEELGQNAIVIRVQPDEGVTLRFGAKVPGAQMEVRDVTMDFGYGRAFTESSPEAYERLILDVLLGEPPLFPRHEEVELSWQILDPIEKYWATKGRAPEQYPAGTWGPASADAMMQRDGREWRLP